MNVQGQGDAERLEPAANARPADRAIDFTRDSTEQLRELQYGIDRKSFPRNFANLTAELAGRENDSSESAVVTAGRLLPATGFGAGCRH